LEKLITEWDTEGRDRFHQTKMEMPPGQRGPVRKGAAVDIDGFYKQNCPVVEESSLQNHAAMPLCDLFSICSTRFL
jgi:hypothetical protein